MAIFAILAKCTLQNSRFFPKIVNMQSRLSPVSLSVLTLAPDLAFEDRSSAFAKNTDVLQSQRSAYMWLAGFCARIQSVAESKIAPVTMLLRALYKKGLRFQWKNST